MLLPPTGHVIRLIRFFGKFPIPTGSQICSTGVTPMAMNGKPKNLPFDFSHRWPSIEHTWPSVGSMELTWPSVRCNGVLVRAVHDVADVVVKNSEVFLLNVICNDTFRV